MIRRAASPGWHSAWHCYFALMATLTWLFENSITVEDSAQELIAQADQAMYRNKNAVN